MSYFFGSKTKTSNTKLASPPQVGTCLDWAHSKQTKFGGLVAQGNAYTTLNKVIYTYIWPKGNSGVVYNAILEQGIGYYDHSTKTFVNPFTGVKCPVKRGFCREATNIVVWTPPEKIECPAEVPIGERKLIFHYMKNRTIPSRMEIPSMGFTVFDWKSCKVSKRCFSGATYSYRQ